MRDISKKQKTSSYMRAYYAKKKKNPTLHKECTYCGKDFLTHIAKVRNCSKECGFLGRKTSILKKCLFCTKPYSLNGKRIETAKYCSHQCSSSARIGERAANWQGGRTAEADKLRTSKQYKEWRTMVFERDNFTCVKCGDSTGGNLEADHIKPKSLFPELILSVDNGRTLCKSCHKATDTWGRKLFTYRKQLNNQFKVAKRF